MGVDFIGKQENLCDDLVLALTAAREFFDEKDIRLIPPINQAADLIISSSGGFDSNSVEKKYGDRAAWTPALRQLVYDSEKEIFEKYDYTQGS